MDYKAEMIDEHISVNMKNEMISLLANTFVEREPMAKHLASSNPEVFNEMVAISAWMIDEMLPGGLCSIVKNENGKVVGMMLAEQYGAPLINNPPNIVSLAPIMVVLDTLSNIFSNTRNGSAPNNEKILHISMVAVDKEYTKNKLSAILFFKTFEIAMNMGYVASVIKATSESQILLDRFGFSTLGEVIYEDVEIEGVKPFVNMNSGFKSAKLMYINLGA